MKKILLLSALFGGFVLNNGYCYDENQETLREIGIHVLNCKVQTYNIKGKISKLLSRHKLIPAISDTLNPMDLMV